MNLLRIALILFVLFPLTGLSQSSDIGSSDDIPNTIAERFKSFTEASKFFFSTLKNNFGHENDGENMQQLMQIFSKWPEEPEDFFRLQVDLKEFKILNSSLELTYNNFFPVHIYFYEKGTEFNNRILVKSIRNKICDTLEIITPPDMPCHVPRNPFAQGSLKNSFREQLLKDKTPSKVKEEMKLYLSHTINYLSAIEFSIDSTIKYSVKEFNEMYTEEFNRILASFIFWEYLADCANYDLNTRKYFYEE